MNIINQVGMLESATFATQNNMTTLLGNIRKAQVFELPL